MSGCANELPLVEASIFRCGCLTAYTNTPAHGKVLAEAEYCEEGLRIARSLKAQRDLVRATDLADRRWAGRFARLEEIEQELHAHRRSSGVLQRARRPASLDPRKIVGEIPKPRSLCPTRSA